MDREGMMWFIGSQRVRHDWATELNWTSRNLRILWTPSPSMDTHYDLLYTCFFITILFLQWTFTLHFLFFLSFFSPFLPFFLFCFIAVQSLCRVWLCDPVDCSTPGFPDLHHLLEFAQTHVHWFGDSIQPSHSLSSPSPTALNLSQHQGLFQWVRSSEQVAKILEFQFQHWSFQWTPRIDLL